MTDVIWTAPAGVTQVFVECWASGGGGRIGQSFPLGGSSGGGGAYASQDGIVVIPGNTYLVRFGDQSALDGPGEESLFINPGTVRADPGQSGGFGAGGAGGQAAASTGTVKHSGGNGVACTFGIPSPGAGGGSNAGRTVDGTDGTVPAGAPAPAGGGGKGGDGGPVNTPGTPGQDGSAPGGGGGGGGSDTVSGGGASKGAQGGVNIWNTTGGIPEFTALLAAFGSALPGPITPGRKAAFIM
jgi:hypothetical protein